MSEPVVLTRDLTKVYGAGRQEVRALDGVSLSIEPGEFVAIVGPSGSGKSTLLNMIGALDRPSSGEVIIDGSPLSEVKNLDRFRSNTIGFVFQMHNLIPTLTARENVEVPMYERHRSARQRHERALELLELVGLSQRAGYLPNKMSGGERQRVAVARALANEPAILLGDEPTGNLDSHTTADIMDLLQTLNDEQGATLIVVTHNSQVASVARRVVTIRDGKIQSDAMTEGSFDQDLLELKQSALGQALLQDDSLPPDLKAIAPDLRKLLEQI